MRRKPRRRCANCGHHFSAHPFGKTVKGCAVPGCTCTAYVKPEPGQRIPSGH